MQSGRTEAEVDFDVIFIHEYLPIDKYQTKCTYGHCVQCTSLCIINARFDFSLFSRETECDG